MNLQKKTLRHCFSSSISRLLAHVQFCTRTDRQTDSSCLWLMWFVEHTQTVDGLDTKLPVYANTSEMALKLKTSAERKASKQQKYKKGKTKEDPLKV